MISRISDNDFHKYDDSEDLKVQSIIKSTSNHKFVFGVNKNYYKYIKINDYDKDFFKNIILKQYLIKTNNNYTFIKRIIKNFYTKFLYLFSNETKYVIDNFGIDKRYTSTGWKYPKKVTQIGFISIILLILTLFWFINLDYELLPISKISLKLLINEANTSIIVALVIFGFWLFRYVFNIKEIIYGKYSIDGYCWHFFTYRVQYLNNTKNIVPIYFSRSFYRYYKTNLYVRFIKIFIKNKDFDEKKEMSSIVERIFNIYKKRYSEKFQKIMSKTFDEKKYTCNKKLTLKNKLFIKFNKQEFNESDEKEHCNYSTKYFENYISKLMDYKKFDADERFIHNLVVDCFNNFKKNKKDWLQHYI